MGRPHLSVMGVIYEALGFATSKFCTALRVAWLPLVLLILVDVILQRVGLMPEGPAVALKIQFETGWITKFIQAANLPLQAFVTGGQLPIELSKLLTYLGIAAVGIILQASYMVPLIKYAANGERPHHGSMHLGFGLSHLRYVLAAALSFIVIVILLQFAIYYTTQWFTSDVAPLLQMRKAVFEPGSLHSIAGQEESFQGLKASIQAVDQWLTKVLGLRISSLNIILFSPLALAAGYLLLRLLAWPYLAAAGRGSAIGGSLRLSGGWNIFPMASIVIVYGVLVLLTTAVTVYAVYFVFGLVFQGSSLIVTTIEGFEPGVAGSAWVMGGLNLLFGVVIIAIQAFLAAFQAGLGGALVHRAQR